MEHNSLIFIAAAFFFIANPIGNSPAILALIKDFDFPTQKRIILREVFAAFCLALFFLFFGDLLFGRLLAVKNYATSLTGGILLALVAYEMIFPMHHDQEHPSPKAEPFIVPIATPLLSGPGFLTITMLYASQEEDNMKVFWALVLAWIGIGAVLYISPYLKKILGKRGLTALEQLMGMMVAMMAVDMILVAIVEFVKALGGSS